MLEANEWMAVVWLAALSLASIAYLWRLLKKSDYGLWESCLYAPTYLMGRLLWRVRFTNAAPTELSGGALLVANHRSSVDPFFVQLAARRRVHWLVAKEYCEHFIFGPILRTFQVIPTNRSGMDTAATKHAVRLARLGKLVGMFPEGQLNHTRLPLLPVRSGAALIAARAAVPIVPLFIDGSPYRKTVWSPLFIPARVSITFGTPIYPQESESGQQPTGQSGIEHAASPASTNHSRQQPEADELVASDGLILEWARQVVAMAGRPEFPVQLASKRKRRRPLEPTSGTAEQPATGP